MNTLICDYLKRRLFIELPVWLGIPFLGVFFSQEPVPWKKMVIFSLAIIFVMAHIVLYNDWGGIKVNPNEVKRFSSNKNIDIISVTNWLLFGSMLSFLGWFLLWGTLVSFRILIFVAFVGACLSALYSHPSIHLKESFLGSKMIHLLGGEVQFLLGFMVFSSDIWRGALIGLFFSLVFIAGHCVQECADVEEDKEGGVLTGAREFGIYQTVIVAIGIFFLAHLYFFVLAIYGVITWAIFFMFVLPVIFHGKFMWNIRKKMEFAHKEINLYRRLYRLAYAFCAICFVLFNVNLIVF